MFSALYEKIKNDLAFRIKFFLALTLVFNIVYSMSLFIISRIYSSKWFLVMATYYGLLSIVRYICFFQIKKASQTTSKIKILRVCSIFLLLINLVVATMMFILIRENQNVKYHEIVVIELATYTFASLTIAIINCVKYLKEKDYIFSCVKIISLTTASVSLVTLTNTMLATWDGSAMLRSIVLPTLSCVVSIFIVACAIFMMIKANLVLRKSNDE